MTDMPGKRRSRLIGSLAVVVCGWAVAGDAIIRTGRSGPIDVKVQSVLGVPTFTIREGANQGYRPFMTPCFETYRPELRYFRQFAATGTRLYSFNTNAAACDYGHSRPTWTAPETWDYRNFDERMQRVLAADPDALVFPRINLGTPPWWLDAHPEEMEILDHGSTRYREPNRNPTLPGDRPFPSLGSVRWRTDIGEALRRFLRHVKQAGFGDHIFGYFLAGLDTEEWYHWSSGSNQLAGYSPPTRNAFRSWLRRRYRDVTTLRRAWNRPDVTFETVRVPLREHRFDLNRGTFRDPATTMPVVDFYRFYNELVPETIDYFARIVKQETGGTKVVGAFYGYMYEFRGDPEYGHNALEVYNRSRNLDFIFVTASYENRSFATGGDYSRSPAHSVKLHGKLWYHDNDVCSFLAPKVLAGRGMPAEGGLNTIKNTLRVLGCTDTPEQTIWMYRRAMGFALTSGAYESFFDLHGGYYDHPELLAEVARLNRVAEVAVRYPRTSASQILVVSDEASCDYATFRSLLLEQTLLHTQHRLIKIGSPADHVLLNDLEWLDTAPYKFVVFLNVYAMTDAQREVVARKLKNDGRVLLWCYAPGLFNGNRRDETGIQELTAMRIRPAPSPRFVAPRINPVDGKHILNRRLRRAAPGPWGPERPSCRLFFVENGQDGVSVLGTHPESGRAALAVRDMGTWQSVYSLTGTLPPAVYRELARWAGVHIFNERDDTFYANDTMVCLHANGAGARTIRFPWACDIVDVITERPLAVNSDSLTYEFKNGETLLMRWRTRL